MLSIADLAVMIARGLADDAVIADALAHFQDRTVACYRAPWKLPGPGSHRQVTTALWGVPSALLDQQEEHAFDMLVTLLARICYDPYDPLFSGPTGVPRRRVADVSDFGSSYSQYMKPLVRSAFSTPCGQADTAIHQRSGTGFLRT